jgi:23S rRNA pseudouridine2605 synthase
LQKVLADAGVASRRASENLIREGRVLVNGATADIGRRIDPSADQVTVDGRRVQVNPTRSYFMLNKPPGVISTASDPEGRTTVVDLVGADARVFPVGRLDAASEGLILMTDDGELAFRLIHPSFEVPKTYVAEVTGTLGKRHLRKLAEGLEIGEKAPVKADRVRVLSSQVGVNARTAVELTIHEGPKHVVRRMLEALDRPVIRLVRTAMGPLKLGRLGQGTYRNLTADEVATLYREVGL